MIFTKIVGRSPFQSTPILLYDIRSFLNIKDFRIVVEGTDFLKSNNFYLYYRNL